MKKEAAAENMDSAPKKRFWKKKDFWIVVGVVAVSFAALYIKAIVHDRAITIEPAASVDAQPDYANGKGIDYRERFRLRMDEAILPVEENGWRELLQAFGPLALEQKGLAKEVPWEEFPTNERSKEWFETYWTPVCEKFGLDPKVKPTFLERLDLSDSLLKYGVTGQEDGTLSSVCGTYHENGEEKEGVVSFQDVEQCYDRLRRGSWTAEEFPTAARWIEENADLFDVYTQAVRKPKFRMLRFLGDEPFSVFLTLLPDVQYTREIARRLTIRANYHIGKGDFAGAAEDYKSILLLGKSFLYAQDECLFEHLVGLVDYGAALEIGLDDNLDARPTKEDYVRFCDALDELLADFDIEKAFQVCMQGERDMFYLPNMQDVVVFRRQNGPFRLASAMRDAVNFSSVPRPVEKLPLLGRLYVGAAKRSVLARGSFDDAEFMRGAEEFWEGLAQDPYSTDYLDSVDVEIQKSKSDRIKSKKGKTNESKLLDVYTALLAPAVGSCRTSYERSVCCLNTQRIVLATLRYQAEHGTLPPAFTVDAEGKPLHSWRVLILPYLGEEAKALYEKIRLDEPWDSEYNKQFHSLMPQRYRCAARDCGPGQTTYSVMLGDEALFDASGKGKDLNALRTRQDIDVRQQALIVERLDSVAWMRPDDELIAKDCLEALYVPKPASDVNKGVGCRHSSGFVIGLANGACVLHSATDPFEPRTNGVVEPNESSEANETEGVGVDAANAEDSAENTQAE